MLNQSFLIKMHIKLNVLMQNQACKCKLTTVITTTKTFDGATDDYFEYQRLHTDMYCKTNVFFRQNFDQYQFKVHIKFVLWKGYLKRNAQWITVRMHWNASPLWIFRNICGRNPNVSDNRTCIAFVWNESIVLRHENDQIHLRCKFIKRKVCPKSLK